jgi:hypothetical protein
MRRPRPEQVVTNRCSLSGAYGPDEWPLSPGQCRVHETGIKMICEYILQDGRRLGTRRVSSIDTAFVDQLFEKLLFKEVNGRRIERRTTVNHEMKTARTAWNAISRAHPGLFPPRDPFERMGLQSNSRETPHATFPELVAFRAKAIEMGYTSLATGALIGWELLQREAHEERPMVVDESDGELSARR